MIKIGVLSDTHAFLDKRIFTYFNDCHQIWHAGDIGSVELIEELQNFKPTIAVHGNIDNTHIKLIAPKEQRFFCEEVDVYMTHIAGYPKKYNPDVLKILHLNPPKIIVCGHSHILRIIYDTDFNLLYINPGAAGQYGFHKVKTLVKFEIDKTKIQNMQVIELER